MHPKMNHQKNFHGIHEELLQDWMPDGISSIHLKTWQMANPWPSRRHYQGKQRLHHRSRQLIQPADDWPRTGYTSASRILNKKKPYFSILTTSLTNHNSVFTQRMYVIFPIPSTVSWQSRGTCGSRFLHLIKLGSSQTLYPWPEGIDGPIADEHRRELWTGSIAKITEPESVVSQSLQHHCIE